MDGGEQEYEDDHALTDLGAPNCPIDLLPMELSGTTAAPFWRCPECGLAKVS